MVIMKKLILFLLLIMCTTFNVNAQDYTVSGKVYTELKDSINSRESMEIITDCIWVDSKGERYNIFLSKNGRAYVKKISQKTSKIYKKYLPEKLAKEVCKKYGVKYVNNPKTL